MMMPETPPPTKLSSDEKPTGPPKEIARRLIFINAITIVIALCASLTIFARYFGTKDLETPPDDSFITSHAEEVPDGKNAYTFYLDAVVASSLLLEEQQELMRAEEKGQGYDELREDIIANNASALSLIESAANAPLSQAPFWNTFEDESDVDIGTLGRFRTVLSIYHRRLLDSGQEGEAMEYSMRLAELGRRLTASNPVSIDYFQAIAFERVALFYFQESLLEGSHTTDDLLGYVDRLSKLGDDGSILRQAHSQEYFLWNRTIEAFFSGNLTTSDSVLNELIVQIPRYPRSRDYYYHPNRTRTLLLDLFQPLIEDAFLPYSKMRLIPMHEVKALSMKQGITKISPNGASKAMIQIIYPGLLDTPQLKCLLNSEIAVCQVLVALLCFRYDHGAPANNLNDLVPKYLSSLPLDDFDGTPVKYDSELRILYSVGKDLIDDGGDESSDIVWQIDSPSSPTSR